MRVATEEELSQAWNGPEHLAVWACLHPGIIIAGDDLRSLYPIREDLLMKSVHEMLEELIEVRTYLEDRSRFEYSAMKLLDILKTFLYLEHHLLIVNQTELKSSRLRIVLGESTDRVQRIYDRKGAERKRIDVAFGQSIRFKRKDDLKYRSADYDALLHSCESAIQYCHGVYHRLMNERELRGNKV